MGKKGNEDLLQIERCFFGMRQRCSNPNSASYRYYGGKGIRCFLSFEDLYRLWIRDRAHRFGKASIDRINSNYDYVYDNCRFIELSENSKRVDRKNAWGRITEFKRTEIRREREITRILYLIQKGASKEVAIKTVESKSTISDFVEWNIIKDRVRRMT